MGLCCFRSHHTPSPPPPRPVCIYVLNLKKSLFFKSSLLFWCFERVNFYWGVNPSVCCNKNHFLVQEVSFPLPLISLSLLFSLSFFFCNKNRQWLLACKFSECKVLISFVQFLASSRICRKPLLGFYIVACSSQDWQVLASLASTGKFGEFGEGRLDHFTSAI